MRRREYEELSVLPEEASKELKKVSEKYGNDFTVKSIKEDRDLG
ncbi:hypothetical protein [Caldivirga sp.]